MNVLVIGGTGLISTAVTRQLLEKGYDVTIFNRGKSEDRTAGGAKKITGDRKDYPAFEKQISEAGKFDCVIDMICFVPEDAQSVVRAFSGKTGQVIFCSTVDVYQRPAQRYPLLENEPQRPSSDYADGKIKSERVFLEAHERGDFNVTVIRPAYTYGPGMAFIHTMGWDTVLPDRMRKAKPIIVHGDGSALWSCCNVDDEARAFVNAVHNEKAYGQCYHATAEEWPTWDAYMLSIAKALDAPEPELIHIASDILAKVVPDWGDVIDCNLRFNSIYDNTKAKKDLDFKYTIPFAEGAKTVVEWLDSKGEIEKAQDNPLYDRIIAAWKKLGDRMIDELK